MSVITFKDLAFIVDGDIIADNINFKIYGITNLFFENPESDLRFVTNIFQQRIRGYTISGQIFIDNKIIPVDNFFFILNQYKLFDQNETVRDVLFFINPKRAKKVLTDFCIDFEYTSIGWLSIEESRIFEIMLSLVAMPKFIYLDNVDIRRTYRERYLGLLKKYVLKSNSVCLVNADFDRYYDGSVVIQQNNIISMDRKQSLEYDMHRRARIFDWINNTNNSDNIQDTNYSNFCMDNYMKISSTDLDSPDKQYKYRKPFAKFCCENLLTDKSRTIIDFDKNINTDIFRVNILQAISLAKRKYYLMIRKYNNTQNIYKHVWPFIASVLVINILRKTVLKELHSLFMNNIGRVLPFFMGFFDYKNYAASMQMYLLVQLIKRGIFWILRTFIYPNHSFHSLKLITAALQFFMSYGNASIFFEDHPFIAHYVNITISPGTYVISVLIYLFIANAPTFLILGYIFNINCMLIIFINSLFINTVIACTMTKRLREITIVLFSLIYATILHRLIKSGGPLLRLLSHSIYPFYTMELLKSCSVNSIVPIIGMLLTYILSYIFCCYKISRFKM